MLPSPLSALLRLLLSAHTHHHHHPHLQPPPQHLSDSFAPPVLHCAGLERSEVVERGARRVDLVNWGEADRLAGPWLLSLLSWRPGFYCRLCAWLWPKWWVDCGQLETCSDNNVFTYLFWGCVRMRAPGKNQQMWRVFCCCDGICVAFVSCFFYGWTYKETSFAKWKETIQPEDMSRELECLLWIIILLLYLDFNPETLKSEDLVVFNSIQICVSLYTKKVNDKSMRCL